MPNAETTFEDRWGRGHKMYDAINGFSPAFSSSDPNIQPPNYLTYLTDLQAKNLEVAGLKSSYTTGATERTALVKTVKQTSGMVRNYIDSDSALKPWRKTVRDIIKKILNYKVSKPKPPEGTPEPKKRNKGEQSYADLAGLFNSLESTITGIGAPYSPSNVDLQVAGLTALAASFDAKNAAMDTIANNISIAVDERQKMYDGDAGLKERMLAIKAGTRAQYGNESSQFLTVKGIRV